jgi:hypothetical protein
MRYSDILEKFKKKPVFSSSDLKLNFPEEKDIFSQVRYWEKQGYLAKARKGIYVLTHYAGDIDPALIAGKLYEPSYLSLEWALNFHGIIPDIPGTFTSVTTRKTMAYENKFGNFTYQKINPKLFFDYVSRKTEFGNYFIAIPEKAVLDYIYLHKNSLVPEAGFWKEMRIESGVNLDLKKLKNYKEAFDDAKISALIDSFVDFQRNA